MTLRVDVLVILILCLISYIHGEEIKKGIEIESPINLDIKKPASSKEKCGKPTYGITYSPFALDTNTICLPPEQVKKDMQMLGKIAHSVRTYSLANCYENMNIVCESVRKNDQTLLLGLWISKDEEANEVEIGALMDFMNKCGDVVEAVVVGNEALFIQEVELKLLISYIERVRKMLRDGGFEHLVSSAEVWPSLESNIGMEFVKHLDFICMNQQPYWEGWDARCSNSTGECTTAGKYVTLKADGLQTYFSSNIPGGIDLWICESGWPTDGEKCCSGKRDNAQSAFKAVPSIENANFFAKDYIDHAKKRNLPFYLHGSFNEDWKKIWDPCDECEGQQVSSFEDDECNGCVVDYNWGMYDYDRKAKPGFNMPKPYC